MNRIDLVLRLLMVALGLSILFLVNQSILKKEDTIRNGAVILLPLAPVDPRSLMQGDYMRLNYKLSIVRSVEESAGLVQDGILAVSMEKQIAVSDRRIQSLSELRKGELPLRFRQRGRVLKFGAESFFFQEGTGEEYTNAKFGKLRVDSDGNPILVALCDASGKEMGFALK